VVRGVARSFQGRPGAFLTLLPVNGPARVRTEGLRWPLVDEVLEPGSSRGVSNEFATEWAWVAVGEGVVLAIQPA
jgi:thiamine pyrophosphokinase